MTEVSNHGPESKRPAKMKVGVGQKAVGETIGSPEIVSSEQRVIKFVEQTAVFGGGHTPDIISAGVITDMIAGHGLVLRSRLIDSSELGDESQSIRSVEAIYPGGLTECIDIHESGESLYVFGGEGGGLFDDLDVKEREALVTSFFIRHNLDYYAQHPELWRPELPSHR